MSLSKKAFLVSLSISRWTGRKRDKKATETVELTHLTESKVGNYTKKLLPTAKELEIVNAIDGNIRKFFYAQTLPWLNDGSRILSSKNYFEFMNEFAKYKREFERATDSFIKQYPKLQSLAKAQLGNLYNESEYPTSEELKECFSCDYTILPLPKVEDFRAGVLDQDKKKFLKDMREIETRATRECWSRLHDVVNKAADRLKDPNALFRDALIENIQELCTLLPKLNVNDDSKLEKARLEVESTVSKISGDVVRSNKTERADASKKLADIASKMSAYMGGK